MSMNITSTTTWSQERVDALWSEVFGSGFETWEWWRKITYQRGATWEAPARDAEGNVFGGVSLSIEDPDDEHRTRTRTVTPRLLIEALDKASQKYVDTCTGNPIHEHMEWDACSGDVVLQIAVLGDVVYD